MHKDQREMQRNLRILSYAYELAGMVQSKLNLIHAPRSPISGNDGPPNVFVF